VVRVAVEMVQSAGYNLLTLANSFQDMIRRGHPLQELANPLVEALQSPNPLLNAMRPVPDIVAAFTKRLSVLGATPPPPKPVHINYLELLDDARPRNEKEREDEDDGEDEDEE
jgi:hypothetical protein